MTPPFISCDSRLLQLSLTEDLSEREEEALADHLSTCESCRRSLEQLAAGEPHWQRIGEALRDESKTSLHAADDSASAATSDDTIGFNPRHNYATSPFDFAVDFLAPPTRPESLGRLGAIDILQVIGYGGMGIVLKGYQAALNRPVAVKVLAPHLATSGAARQRFAREAQAAAAIVHPNVMPIFTVDESGKLPYLVMPYIDGESLQQRIDRQGALEIVDILRIGLQVSRGLAAAHAQGLVHRDIKPANMLLERGVDRVLLTDFGLARAADDASLTRTGYIAGTPQFMSPEQARGDSIDTRSDLFSLGSVLYTMCTGHPPFRADSSYGVLRRITDTDPRPINDSQPSVPAWLVKMVDRLLAKRVEDRYPSADQVAGLLEQCLAHLQQPTHVAVPVELCPDSGTKKFPFVAKLAVATTLLLSGVGLWAWLSPGTVNDRDSVRARPSSTADADVSALPVPVPAPSAQAAPSAQPPIEWKDTVTPEIQKLRSDVRDFQRRVDAFWD